MPGHDFDRPKNLDKALANLLVPHHREIGQ